LTKSYVYFIENVETKRIKIGKSINVISRFSSIKTSNDCEVKLLGFVEGGHDLEKKLHDRFAASRVRGEWFTEEIEPDVMVIIGGGRVVDETEIEFLNNVIPLIIKIIDESKAISDRTNSDEAKDHLRDVRSLLGSSMGLVKTLIDMHEESTNEQA